MSRRPLDIGLEVVRRVTEAQPALALLRDLGREEGPARPDSVRPGGGEQGLDEPGVAGQVTGLQQVGHDGDIVAGGGDALVQGSHAVAEVEAEVEEEGDELPDLLLECVQGLGADQDQDVHV
jgi:hypothetical protein